MSFLPIVILILSDAKTMNKPARKPNLILGLIGAAIGGVAGYFGFLWFASQGFYALVLPPGLLGLAAGFCARGRSMPLAIICGIAGLALALFIEWKFHAFVKDDSLQFFLTHLHWLKGVTIIMLIVGPIIAFRLALGFDQKSGS